MGKEVEAEGRRERQADRYTGGQRGTQRDRKSQIERWGEGGDWGRGGGGGDNREVLAKQRRYE